MQLLHRSQQFDLDRFTVVGVSFRRTPLIRRGRLALNAESRAEFYHKMQRHGIAYGMILSTCNRTEFYIDRNAADEVLQLWDQCAGGKIMHEHGLYQFEGKAALGHLFKVTTGADSQIPGDMQITAQVKEAYSEARQAGMIDGLFERMINAAIHTNRIVKSETDLSAGVSSVPSAVALAVRQSFGVPLQEKVAIIGLGKMGALSCQNLLKIAQSDIITVLNRSESRAMEFAEQAGTRYLPFSELDRAIGQSAIIIVSTGSEQPILQKCHFKDGKRRLVFDLSMPHNVERTVAGLPGVSLMDLDHLSAVAQRDIRRREGELEDVNHLIDSHIQKAFDWWIRRQKYQYQVHLKSSFARRHAV